VGGKGDKKEIQKRADQLTKQLEQTTSKFDKEKLQERVSKLTGGVAVIRVGAATETEAKYLKDKIEDAVNATKAALAEGIIPGGGASLVKVAAKLTKNIEKHTKAGNSEMSAGYAILVNALSVPFKQIVRNTGREDEMVLVQEISGADNKGFDALNEQIVDMIEAGIIDPVKVTRSGVENAASAAAVLLTTEAAIADLPEEKKVDPNMGGMGGLD
jgi:chaperonin GroEL